MKKFKLERSLHIHNLMKYLIFLLILLLFGACESSHNLNANRTQGSEKFKLVMTTSPKDSNLSNASTKGIPVLENFLAIYSKETAKELYLHTSNEVIPV